MSVDIHTCSYYCDRPGCIKAQRDELRERLYAMDSPSHTEAEVLAAAKRMGEVEVLASSGCETMFVKDYFTPDEIGRMARAALGVQ